MERLVPEGVGSGGFERILSLKRVQALSELPLADLAAMADLMVERSVPPGTVLLREGEPARALYFVLEGVLQCRRLGRSIGGKGPGDGIGGLVLFARDQEGVGATAEVETRVLELDADALHDFFEDRYRVLHHVMRGICRQLLDLVIRTKSMPFQGLASVDPARHAQEDFDLVERIFFLRSMLPFRRSSINALAELSRNTNQMRLPAGTELWKAGDPGSSAYIVLAGTVAGRVAASGVTFQAGPGTPLGASEMMAERPRWYDAVAETPFVALQGGADALFDVLEDNYGMASDYLAMWARAVLNILEALADSEGYVAL